MINYENYNYKQNCVFGKQERKDRLEIQLGDFGEQMVMTLLGRIARYSVAYVDHEGADLIAVDQLENRYAISVKTAQIGPNESQTKTFYEKDQKKLCEFAKDFGLIPAVAMIFIPRDFAFIDTYVLTLDSFIDLSKRASNKIECDAIKVVKNGLEINNYSLEKNNGAMRYSDSKGYLKYLQNNEYIEHIRMDVHNRENFRQGIRQKGKGNSIDVECIKKLLEENSGFKDGNLRRQLGDAGEYFLMMLLGQQKKCKVARVDHVGADLIAVDRQGNKYAISVKTCRDSSYTFKELYTNGRSVKNPKYELGKLQSFADKYGMIASIACIFIKKDFSEMDIYFSSLYNWIKNSDINGNDTNAICFTPSSDYYGSEKTFDIMTEWNKIMSTFKISIGREKNRKYINEIQGVEHIKIKFDSLLNPDLKW